MRRLVWGLLAVFCLSGILAGCAKPPRNVDATATASTSQVAKAYAAQEAPLRLAANLKYSELTGRTIRVSRIEDIQLRDKEVVLTFDDGPHPSRTLKILDALDSFGVKAVFLAVGSMAERNPEVLQEVARHGHVIGTHTHDHSNLRSHSELKAMDQIEWGYRSVAEALAPIGKKPALFFRFPYLADTHVLRASLAGQNMVVLDVDIDSKDYTQLSPQQVLDQTLARLERRGRGIVLFHDIQARTAAMMPEFLEALAERGYEVVNLVPGNRSLFERALVTAEIER